jgi:hypothetical protein
VSSTKKINLTISIPSFRRPTSLIRQLLALDRELQTCPDGLRVDVVVRLNGTHEHEGLASQLQCPAAGECFRIVVNPANIGGNANIALSFLDGIVGGYIWVLSDNDIIRKGLLAGLYASLGFGRPDVVFLEGAHELDIPCGTRLFYGEMNSFRHHPLVGLGLISRGIYRVDYVSFGMESMFMYHNSSFPHLALVLAAFRQHGQCLVKGIPGPAFEEEVVFANDFYCNSGYDLSRTGGLQLITLMPKAARPQFAKEFLFGGGLDFVRAFRSYPVNGMTTLFLILFNWPLGFFVWPYALGVDVFRRIRVKLGKAISER